MKHESINEQSYKGEAKHWLWYLFWCGVSGLVGGVAIAKASDHTEKAGYWRGVRTAYQIMDKNENN